MLTLAIHFNFKLEWKIPKLHTYQTQLGSLFHLKRSTKKHWLYLYKYSTTIEYNSLSISKKDKQIFHKSGEAQRTKGAFFSFVFFEFNEKDKLRAASIM